MKLTTLFIGNELLIGQTTNTNLTAMGEKLLDKGYRIYRSETIPDGIENIQHAVEKALKDSDIVVTVGGLGPTSDDITRKAVADACGKDVYTSDAIIDHLKERLKDRYPQPHESYLRNQAESIKDATVHYNTTGFAPILELEVSGKKVFLLPGPPREFKPAVDKVILPYLEKEYPSEVVTELLMLYGAKESDVEARSLPLIEKYPNMEIAYCASMGRVAVRITFAVEKQDEFGLALADAKEIYKAELIGTDNIAEEVLNLCREKSYSLATTESCTGGMIGAEITAIPGSSDTFVGSVNVYSNEWKQKMLGVSSEILEKYGAVSKECAEEMVRGLANKYQVDCAISVTGIAGPGGGTEDKPVGLVYIGVLVANKCLVYEYKFRGGREDVRKQACLYALNQLKNILIK